MADYEYNSNHEYTKEELLRLYKEYFFDNIPFISERIRPEPIGVCVTDDRYNLYLGYDEKEGSSFLFSIGPLIKAENQKNLLKLEEVEPEKIAYMLSEPWGSPTINYENKKWTYCSCNEWKIWLTADSLETLFEYYNCIVGEVAGKIIDSYPDNFEKKIK